MYDMIITFPQEARSRTTNNRILLWHNAKAPFLFSSSRVFTSAQTKFDESLRFCSQNACIVRLWTKRQTGDWKLFPNPPLNK